MSNKFMAGVVRCKSCGHLFVDCDLIPPNADSSADPRSVDEIPDLCKFCAKGGERPFVKVKSDEA